jgi:uncharacterized protein YdiU (UPF0061 family)
VALAAVDPRADVVAAGADGRDVCTADRGESITVAVGLVCIPRNHQVEEALAAAVVGDLDPLERLLAVVASPHEKRPGLERYAAPAPEDLSPDRTFCGT